MDFNYVIKNDNGCCTLTLQIVNGDEQSVFNAMKKIRAAFTAEGQWTSKPKAPKLKKWQRELMSYAPYNKLKAVKILKDITGMGLREAKEWCDNRWDKLENGTVTDWPEEKVLVDPPF